MHCETYLLLELRTSADILEHGFAFDYIQNIWVPFIFSSLFFSTTQSTYVKSLTRRIKGGISFVNQAATNPKYGRPVATKRVKVDGLRADSEDYPYFTVFTLVTQGEPTGAAKQFIEFIFLDDFATVIKAHGIVLLRLATQTTFQVVCATTIPLDDLMPAFLLQ